MTEILLLIAKILIYFGMTFTIIRMIKGPRILDRVLCLDALSVCVIGLLILESIKWDSPYFIDLILVFSLLNFIGTVSYCYYLYTKDEMTNE